MRIFPISLFLLLQTPISLLLLFKLHDINLLLRPVSLLPLLEGFHLMRLSTKLSVRFVELLKLFLQKRVPLVVFSHNWVLLAILSTLRLKTTPFGLEKLRKQFTTEGVLLGPQKTLFQVVGSYVLLEIENGFEQVDKLASSWESPISPQLTLVLLTDTEVI